MKKTWAVADIHGCYKELMALFKKLPIDLTKHRLVVLGDSIDRGPDTKKVVQQLMRWKKKYRNNVVVLYGNHCDLMLDALLYGGRIYHSYDLWWSQGGKETTESYIPKRLSDYERALVNPLDVIPKSHLEFLAKLPRYFQDEKYIYVHGGLKPGVKLEDQKGYDLIWIRDEFICSPTGLDKKVIFGHTVNRMGQYRYNGPWALFNPIVYPDKVGIDTAVRAAEGKLTILELPEEKFHFQERIQ